MVQASRHRQSIDLHTHECVEVLRQPLQTTVAIDRLDFDEFNVEEKVHIGISVKDFRAIITHAESLRATITAKYSVPKQPLQFSYQEHGMLCEFTLVTIGEFRGGSVTPAPAPAVVHPADRPSARPESRNPSNAARSQTTNNSMPPPVQPASRSFTREPENRGASRPSPLPPQASINQDSLFLQDDDEEEEERRWGERSYDKNEDEDELTWVCVIVSPPGLFED
jgi:cell cycle checkpoint control protein RAD9A